MFRCNIPSSGGIPPDPHWVRASSILEWPTGSNNHEKYRENKLMRHFQVETLFSCGYYQLVSNLMHEYVLQPSLEPREANSCQ
jgi:hypothetical protein